MKKEFNELRENVKEYSVVYEEFLNARSEFNTNLDVTEVEGLVNYYDENCTDAYDIAKNFFMLNGDVLEAAATIKSEHPRYGLPRFKSTLVTAVIDSRDTTFEEAHEVVNAYLLLDNAGYTKVSELEVKAKEIEAKGIANCDAIVTQSKEAVVNAGKKVATTVGNIARPYGEVAKGQLSEAGTKAKELANSGTKKLIKLLEKVEEKTSNK